MARNLISGPILTRLGQMWAKQNLFRGFYLYQYLDIVPIYHPHAT